MKAVVSVLALAATTLAQADLLLYDNGPMVTHHGQGFGGADVSMCSVDPDVPGLEFKSVGPQPEVFSIADDFTVAQDANVNSVDLFGYETGAGTPGWNVLDVALWLGKPGAGGVPIASADSVAFSPMGLYRTYNSFLLDSTMQVNQIHAVFTGVPLKAGTSYWVSMRVVDGGQEAMANFVMDPNEGQPDNPVTRKGNALQFREEPPGSGNFRWAPALAGSVNVSFPFLVNGSLAERRIAPSGMSLTLGKVQSGGLASLAANDGDRLVVCKFFVPNQQSPFVEFTLTGTGAQGGMTDYRIEALAKSLNAGAFSLTLSGYDYTRGGFDAGTTAAIGLADKVFSHVPASPSNYSESGQVQARVRIRQTGPSTALFPCVSFDSVNWFVRP